MIDKPSKNNLSDLSGRDLLSSSHLKAIMPNAPAKVFDKFLIEFQKLLPVYNINTPLRIAAFMSQGAVESGELRALIENLNYSASRIVAVWPKRFHTVDDAIPYAHNPEKLGNNVYAHRLGNGNEESGEGFKYRGRGWFSGTGKDFYKKMAKLTTIDFNGNPDLMAEPHYAVLSACEFWKSKGIESIADSGDLRRVTLLVNGGYTGIKERTVYYERAKKIYGIV